MTGDFHKTNPALATDESLVKQYARGRKQDGVHAPKGGITVKGTYYPGGEYVPSEAMASWSTTDRNRMAAALTKSGRPEDAAKVKAMGQVATVVPAKPLAKAAAKAAAKATPAPSVKPPGKAKATPAPSVKPSGRTKADVAGVKSWDDVKAAKAAYKKQGIRSPWFKRWFGDWEKSPETSSIVVNHKDQVPDEMNEISGKGSIATDHDGKPLAMYHGTSVNFEAFDPKFDAGTNLFGKGFYFTNTESVAKTYMDMRTKAASTPSIGQSGVQRLKELHSKLGAYELPENVASELKKQVDNVSSVLKEVEKLIAENPGIKAESVSQFRKEAKPFTDALDALKEKEISPFAARTIRSGVHGVVNGVFALVGGGVPSQTMLKFDNYGWDLKRKTESLIDNELKYVHVRNIGLGAIDKDGKIDSGATPEQKAPILSYLKAAGIPLLSDTLSPTIHKSYLNIRRPLDMDERVPSSLAKPISESCEMLKNKHDDQATVAALSRISHLAQSGSPAEMLFDVLKGINKTDIFKDIMIHAGIDGLTHLGGLRQAGPDEPVHRVYIAFHPEQIKDVENEGTFDPDDVRKQYNMSQAPDGRFIVRYAFDSSSHPRGNPKNKGEFAKKGASTQGQQVPAAQAPAPQASPDSAPALRQPKPHEMAAHSFGYNELSPDKQDALYDIFKKSYTAATGGAWDRGTFESRAHGWRFYGNLPGHTSDDKSGFVAVRPQRSGLLKLVGAAGHPKAIIRGFMGLIRENPNSPIWGAMSENFGPHLKRSGFLEPPAELMKQVVDDVPFLKAQYGDAGDSGSFKVNVAGGVGQAEKRFYANREYFKSMLRPPMSFQFSDKTKQSIQGFLDESGKKPGPVASESKEGSRLVRIAKLKAKSEQLIDKIDNEITAHHKAMSAQKKALKSAQTPAQKQDIQSQIKQSQAAITRSKDRQQQVADRVAHLAKASEKMQARYARAKKNATLKKKKTGTPAKKTAVSHKNTWSVHAPAGTKGENGIKIGGRFIEKGTPLSQALLTSWPGEHREELMGHLKAAKAHDHLAQVKHLHKTLREQEALSEDEDGDEDDSSKNYPRYLKALEANGIGKSDAARAAKLVDGSKYHTFIEHMIEKGVPVEKIRNILIDMNRSGKKDTFAKTAQIIEGFSRGKMPTLQNASDYMAQINNVIDNPSKFDSLVPHKHAMQLEAVAKTTHENRYAEAIEYLLSLHLGSIALPDNEAIDNLYISKDGRVNGLEIKTRTTSNAKDDRVQIKDSVKNKKKKSGEKTVEMSPARFEKAKWVLDDHNRMIHAVIIDHRAIYSGPGALSAAIKKRFTHDFFYRRGVGTKLDQKAMYKVKDVAELKELLEMDDKQLSKWVEKAKGNKKLYEERQKVLPGNLFHLGKDTAAVAAHLLGQEAVAKFNARAVELKQPQLVKPKSYTALPKNVKKDQIEAAIKFNQTNGEKDED